jgi:hypothetical protein
VVQCIFLFSLLIFIFTSQLETKVFTRFTVHTFFFYFFIIEHVIGTIYITFIGNEALEDFVGIDYSKLDYLLLGYSMFMVTYSLGMIFSHVMLEARRKKKLFLYSSRIN